MLATYDNNGTLPKYISIGVQGIIQNCQHFHKRTQRMLEGGGSRAAVRFSKMPCIMVHCGFEKGSQNQQFQSTLLVGREGGGNKKEYSYTLDKLLTILDGP